MTRSFHHRGHGEHSVVSSFSGRVRLAVFLLAGGAFFPVAAQTVPAAGAAAGVERDIDPGIAAVIGSIRAIDNHAHPVLPPPNDGLDRGFDALPVDNMEPETDPVAWRPDNPQLML